MELDMERRLAIAELLARPDPPDMRRGHRLRLAGKPDRYKQVALLSAAFVQSKLLALHERRIEMNVPIACPDVARHSQRARHNVIPVAA